MEERDIAVNLISQKGLPFQVEGILVFEYGQVVF